MKSRVHQFLPSLGYRDAVGTHTLCTQLALADAAGDIWAEDIHPTQLRKAKHWTGYQQRSERRRRGNVMLYQCSTGSRGLASFVAESSQPKAIYYHNITPAHFFEAYDPGAAINLARGRDELRALAATVKAAMANSEYSAGELRELDVQHVTVVPPYLPPALEAAPNPTQLSWIRRTKKGADLLFVSRIVPNKGHVPLLRMFAALRAAIDPGARLFVVGAWGSDSYMRTIFRLRERLALEGIVFCGLIAEDHLAAYYAGCDAFVSMSEHEGFGLPLIEAMRAGLPVIAYDGGAVAETLGGAGILVRSQDPFLVAELVGKVMSDEAMSGELIVRQRARLAELDRVDRDEIMRSVLLPLL